MSKYQYWDYTPDDACQLVGTSILVPPLPSPLPPPLPSSLSLFCYRLFSASLIAHPITVAHSLHFSRKSGEKILYCLFFFAIEIDLCLQVNAVDSSLSVLLCNTSILSQVFEYDGTSIIAAENGFCLVFNLPHFHVLCGLII